MMAKRILTAAAATALAGCAGVAIVGPEPDVMTEQPTVSAVTSISGVTPAQLPQAVSTGPALDLDWTNRYQAGVPYVNAAPLPVSVFSGPDGRDQIARLSPGNGGAIDACAVEVDMCSISFGTDRQRGWVLMENMQPATATPTAG